MQPDSNYGQSLQPVGAHLRREADAAALVALASASTS